MDGKFVPDGGGQQDDTCLATLAVGGHLAGVATFARSRRQVSDLVNAQSSGVQQAEEHIISPRAFLLEWRALKRGRLVGGDEETVNVAFGQDPLGQRVFRLQRLTTRPTSKGR
jgi:hypothetical protein